jgi:hypothetical protein
MASMGGIFFSSNAKRKGRNVCQNFACPNVTENIGRICWSRDMGKSLSTEPASRFVIRKAVVTFVQLRMGHGSCVDNGLHYRSMFDERG